MFIKEHEEQMKKVAEISINLVLGHDNTLEKEFYRELKKLRAMNEKIGKK